MVYEYPCVFFSLDIKFCLQYNLFLCKYHFSVHGKYIHINKSFFCWFSFFFYNAITSLQQCNRIPFNFCWDSSLTTIIIGRDSFSFSSLTSFPWLTFFTFNTQCECCVCVCAFSFNCEFYFLFVFIFPSIDREIFLYHRSH